MTVTFQRGFRPLQDWFDSELFEEVSGEIVFLWRNGAFPVSSSHYKVYLPENMIRVRGHWFRPTQYQIADIIKQYRDRGKTVHDALDSIRSEIDTEVFGELYCIYEIVFVDGIEVFELESPIFKLPSWDSPNHEQEEERRWILDEYEHTDRELIVLAWKKLKTEVQKLQEKQDLLALELARKDEEDGRYIS